MTPDKLREMARETVSNLNDYYGMDLIEQGPWDDDIDTVQAAILAAYNTGVSDAEQVARNHSPVSISGVIDTRIIHGAGMAMTIANAIRQLLIEAKP